jgi:hypothetical protein
VLLGNELFLTFGCGGSRLVVTRSITGTADEATEASWHVDDVAAEVARLRARGVQIQDLPEPGTVDGIADIGFALAAGSPSPTTTRSASSSSRKVSRRAPRRPGCGGVCHGSRICSPSIRRAA